MITFKQLTESLAEAWPGTPEYNKKFGKPGSVAASMAGGNRHEISKSDGVTRATRKYDPKTGESEDMAKDPNTGAAPVKRGRGRPPGQYGSYKKKVQEALEHMDTLETEEELTAFVESLDEETLRDLVESVTEEIEEEVIEIEEGVMDTVKKIAKKAADVLGGPDDEGQIKDLQRKMGLPQTGKKPGVKEEAEQIDELSKDTLNSYRAQATGQAIAHHHSATNSTSPEKIQQHSVKTQKRMVGASRAYQKALAKEEVEQIEEAINAKDYHVTSEKSLMTGGHRPKVVHKTKGTTMHLGQHSYKSPEDAKAHAQAYLDAYAKSGPNAAGDAAHSFASKNKDKQVVKEAADKEYDEKDHDEKDHDENEMDENIKHPNQHSLDKNKNGKLDKDDFKILRGEKKHEVKESEFKIGDQVIAESWFGIKRGIVTNIDANGKVYVKHNDAAGGTGVYNGSYDPAQIKKR